MEGTLKMEKIFTAKTLDDAIALAAAEFNTEKEKLNIEVIEEPKKGLFGMKGEAKIKVSYEPSKLDKAVSYVRGVLTKMGVAIVDIKVTENDDGVLLDIVTEGDGDGIVIGRRGENLDAIQYLTSLVCNKGADEYYRITLDSCGYRAKRKETLEKLAARIARNVSKTGRSSALEPMNPYERRIIHSVIAEIDGVESHSTGEEPYRKVIITSTNKKPYRGKAQKPRRQPKSDGFMTSFEKEYKRQQAAAPAPTDEISVDLGNDDVPLYGKIEF